MTQEQKFTPLNILQLRAINFAFVEKNDAKWNNGAGHDTLTTFHFTRNLIRQE